MFTVINKLPQFVDRAIHAHAHAHKTINTYNESMGKKVVMRYGCGVRCFSNAFRLVFLNFIYIYFAHLVFVWYVLVWISSCCSISFIISYVEMMLWYCISWVICLWWKICCFISDFFLSFCLSIFKFVVDFMLVIFTIKQIPLVQHVFLGFMFNSVDLIVFKKYIDNLCRWSRLTGVEQWADTDSHYVFRLTLALKFISVPFVSV